MKLDNEANLSQLYHSVVKLSLISAFDKHITQLIDSIPFLIKHVSEIKQPYSTPQPTTNLNNNSYQNTEEQ